MTRAGTLALCAVLGCTVLPKNEGDAAVCAAIWKRTPLVPGASATATVETGALVLRARNMSGAVLYVGQTNLTGDFRVTFDYESFTPGGAGAYVRAAVSDDASGIFAAAAVTSTGVTAGLHGLGSDVDTKSATLTQRGTFVLARTGSSMTVTATNGTTTATKTAGFANTPARIGVEIGTDGATVSGDTSIRITAFSIEGGGGAVRGDAFECNSVRD
jgi:hypothetical protein